MALRYLKDVVTLELDSDKCTGCGLCTHVCGHAYLQSILKMPNND